MKPEEWRQIEQLYLDALERPPEQRPAFLAMACADNEAIRREVESLLANESEMEQFLETPPGVFAASALARKEQAPTMAGRTLGHYQMLSLLGVGGMGEIYLARDLSLDRQVAIKLLPAKFTQDPDRLRRFVREARAASALNHPNILTIYEIGEIGDTHFIATEFVEGETLRQRRARQPLTLRETLSVAIQIASALDAAHKTGIVHRDIKLENLMLRPDGLVKVLDFGLAKLTENWERLRDGETEGQRDRETLPPPLSVSPSPPLSLSTEPGMVMGTPRYMSPEQVRGQKVDARSDIFSLGVVLYEMLAGCAPFEGETANDVIAAVLKTDPRPLKQHWPQVPGELELIVAKMLRKDRETRYQTVKDLQLDLTELKERLDFEAKLAGVHREDSSGGAPGSSGGGVVRNDTMKEPAPRTAEIVSPDTGPTAGYASHGIKNVWHFLRWDRGKWAALAALVVIAAGLVFGWRQLTGRRDQPASPPELVISKLTNTGQAFCAAISPDGNYVVYALDDSGRQSLQLKQVATGSERQIIPPAEVVYRGITFSPDGNFIYYVRLEPEGVLYRTTMLGDAVRKLLDRVHSPITFSPTGRQFAFIRQDKAAGEEALTVANENGTDEKRLAARKPPEAFRLEGPAWSPDGKQIACGVLNAAGGTHQSVVGVRTSDGVEQPLTSRRWERVEQVAWLTRGSGLMMVAAEPRTTLSQLWYLAYPDAEARRIVHDLSNYTSFSLTADSSKLAAVRSDRFVNLWIAPGNGATTARQITKGSQNDDGLRGLAWTPDGKIVYRSLAGPGGNPNIRIVGADGADNRQLSADENQNLDPTVSPDGRAIAWSAGRAGFRNLWRMDLDGGNQRQLTRGKGEWFPQYTPDGKWLIYQAQGSGPNERLLYKMPLDGGEPIQLTDKPSYAPAISPDGKLIACNYRNAPEAPIQIAVISVEGGPPIKIFDPRIVPNSADMLDPLRRLLRWTPDGRGIAFVVTRGDVSNLWSQLLAGGPPKQLTRFAEYRIFNFAWSHDGRQLALSRGGANGEVVLISNFR